jgi:hypothetical protein
LVNSQETEHKTKILDAVLSNRPVTKEDKSNLVNNNASDVKHAQVVKILSETSAKFQDQFAIATKNTTKQTTDALTVQMVNSQETQEVLVVDKIKDARSITNNVTLEVKSNSDKTNASDAKHAQSDKTLLETNAKFQDQLVLAINNTTLPPTDVTTVELVNFQEMDSVFKTEDAKLTNNNVTLMVKSNKDNNNAMLAKPVTTTSTDRLYRTKLLLVTDVFKELSANASKNTIPPLTLAETAQLVNLLMPILEDAHQSTLVATETEEFNYHNNNATNAKTAQLDNNLEPTMCVLFQDHLVFATKLLTETTNAKHAQQDNWLMLPTQDVSPDQTPVTLETKLEEINSTVINAKLVETSNNQTPREHNVLLDHS